MKTSLRKYLSLVMVLCVAFVCLFGVRVNAATEVARFEFGAYDASKTNENNQDGSSATSYSETSGIYTLTLSSMNKVYKGSYDAKGNSCLKLGTSSAKGSFSFTVPADVVEVGILVAGYKAKTVAVSINGGTAQTISTLSSNGEYTEVSVDTTTNKTVSFATGTNYRCKIDAIIFYADGETTIPFVNVSGTAYAEVNDGSQLTANTENTTGTVVWTSSNNAVATVDQTGYVTAVAMGTTTITATVDDIEDSVEFKVFPEDGSELTIAEAIEVAELAGTDYSAYKYVVEGVITEVANTTYGNIYITDGVNDLYVYGLYSDENKTTRYDAMETKPVEGDKIKIKTILGQYGTSNQAKDAALVEIIADEDSVATAKEALKAVAAYMSLGYKYTKDFKDVAATTSVVAKYTEATTTNMAADENNADIIGLDAELFDVTANKCTPSNNVGLNKDGTIRLYASKDDGDGTELVVSTLGGQKIVSIEIEFSSTVGSFTVNDVAGDKNKSKYEINGESFAIKNTTTGVTTQVHIKSITINVEDEEAETVKVAEYSEVDFRIRCGVASTLSSIEGVDSYGIKVFTSSVEKSYESTSEFFKEDQENSMYYVMISLGDVLNNKSRLTEKFTVCAYVVIDGVTYVSETTKTYSVLDMVIEYNELGNLDVSGLYNDLVASGDITE